MQQKMNFEKVSEILKNKGISFEVISFTDEVIAARTEDTSIDHNYDPKNAIKTLVIKSKDGFKAVILKGNDKIDSTKLESIVGKWTVAGEEVLLNEFGFIPGTVCPLALDLPILIDENVMEMPVWSMGTGEIKKGFNVKKDEVVGVLDFEKVTISVKSNTMKFIVDNSLFDKLPGLKIGVLVARNIDNTKSSGISNNSSKLDENLLQKRIDLWHEALTNVGIDCKKFVPSIETLKNLSKIDKRRSINPLVDIYNNFSLETLTPIGAHDIDKLTGDIELRPTKDKDLFNAIGSDVAETLDDKAVAYVCSNQIMTSHWVWRQGKISAVSDNTKNVFIPIDIVDPDTSDLEIKKLAINLAKEVSDQLGGKFSFGIVDQLHQEIDLEKLDEINLMTETVEINNQRKIVEEKLHLITRNCQEVLTVSDLKKLIESGEPIQHYIGFEISGLVHLGTGLMSMGKVADFVKAGVKCKIFLADFHSYLNNKMGGNWENIREATEGYFKEGLIASLKCFGVDESQVEFIMGKTLYEQHPEHWETFMRVGKHITLSRNLRSVSIMGKKQGTEVDMATLFYPPLQVADIFTMNVNLAHAGIDQRKAHVIAREVGPAVAGWTPVAIHQNLIAGLASPDVDHKDEETLKMSKSKPGSAIFVHDTPEEIREKIKKAYGPPKETEFNPLINWVKTLVFWGEETGEFVINRPEKFGGDVTYTKVADLVADYQAEKLFPLDLKNALADWIIAKLEPARKHFEESGPKAGLARMKEMMEIK